MHMLGCAQAQGDRLSGLPYQLRPASLAHLGAFAENYGPKVTHKAWFDFAIESDTESRLMGRLEMGLFGEAVPKTVENFMNLANAPTESGYNGTIVDLLKMGKFDDKSPISSNLGLYLGDLSYTKGIKSSFGDYFKDENYDVRPYGAGWLMMSNIRTKQNTRKRRTGSAFFVMLRTYGHWQFKGLMVTFGKLLGDSMKLAREIEIALDGDWYWQGASGRWLEKQPKVYIADCGAEKLDKPFRVSNQPMLPRGQKIEDIVHATHLDSKAFSQVGCGRGNIECYKEAVYGDNKYVPHD